MMTSYPNNFISALYSISLLRIQFYITVLGVPKQRHHSAHQPPNLSVGVPSVFHAAPPHVGASTAVPYSSACGSSSGASAASASVVTSVMNSPPNAAAAAAPVTPPVFTASPSAAGRHTQTHLPTDSFLNFCGSDFFQ